VPSWGDEGKGRLVDLLAANAEVLELERLAGTRIRMVSIRPERTQVIDRGEQ
jgi:adenylosuccinate synthase